MLAQACHSPLLNEAAPFEKRDAVGDRGHLGDVVGHPDDGHGEPPEDTQQVGLQGATRGRIE